MKLIAMVRNILGRLQSGAVMAEIFSATVRLAGLAFALASLVFWFKTWKSVSAMEGGAVLGDYVAQVIVLAGFGLTTLIFWIRGGDIRQSAVPDFSVLPAVVVLLRMLGEVYASVTATVILPLTVMRVVVADGVGFEQKFKAFALLRQGFEAFAGIASSPSDSEFLLAAKLIVAGLMGSVFWLALFYGMAESLNLSLTIAKSTRSTHEILEQRLPS